METSLSHIRWFYNSTEQVDQKPSSRELRNSPKHVTKTKQPRKANSKIKSKIPQLVNL